MTQTIVEVRIVLKKILNEISIHLYYTKPMADTIIYGRHAIAALLSNSPERIGHLYIAPSAMETLEELARARGVRIEPMTPGLLHKELEGAVHQGAVARVSL